MTDDCKMLSKELEIHQKSDHEFREEIKEELNVIKTNHLSHIQKSVSDITNDMTKMKSDINWIKLIGGFLIATTVTILVRSFLS